MHITEGDVKQHHGLTILPDSVPRGLWFFQICFVSYSTIKKNEIAICSYMDGPKDDHTK